MKQKIVVPIIEALFILLFLYTALSKLTDLYTFRGALIKSPLLKEYRQFISIALPVTELVVVVLLLVPSWKRAGLIASFVLMILFSGYIMYMFLYVPQLPCSCGGVLKLLNWSQHLVLNLLMALLALIALRPPSSIAVTVQPPVRS